MMKRRFFLQVTVATAGATIVGCGSDTGESTTGDTTSSPPRELLDGAELFPQSVASGDPKPNSVILWTRIQDADLADADVDLELELSPEADFSELVYLNEQLRLVVTAKKDFDHCAKVRVEGITPNKVYYYRFVYEK